MTTNGTTSLRNNGDSDARIQQESSENLFSCCFRPRKAVPKNASMHNTEPRVTEAFRKEFETKKERK